MRLATTKWMRQLSGVTPSIPPYIEDEWQVTPDFRLTYGLRYDYYESDDEPALNPAFTADYGFPNTATLDGLDLLMPRIGFTYDMNDSMTLSGGVGSLLRRKPQCLVLKCVL
jgi:outer membrane receptor for ferrienterochelin and colicin